MNHTAGSTSIFRLSLAALAASTLITAGCLADSDLPGDDRAAVGQDDGAKLPGPSLSAPIGQPVFYESNELGEVVGGPIPDELHDTEAFKNAGSRPIHVQKYGPFGNGGTLSTGFPTSDWIAVVVGMDTTDGDINEVGVGDPLRAFPFQSNGIWNVTFDLRSHRDNESWSIWVMYIQRSMASATNF